jgi:hypothetical protein
MSSIFDNLTAQDMEVLVQKAATTGVGFTASSGLQAIQLDAIAKLAYAIFYPELEKVPHIQPEMAGERWGGQSFQWKSITAPNATSLPAPVSQGNRNAIASITAVPYAAPYATLGYDQSVTDEGYEQARGFDDLVNDARITTMHNILQQYDVMVTCGNRGSDSNGFALGTANTPAQPTTAATGGTIGASTKVTVQVVELSAYGSSPKAINYNAATGLTPFISRTPANLTAAEYIPAGVGLISSSANVTTGGSTSTNTVTASVTPKTGAFGWAWYVSTAGSPGNSNTYFYGITYVPEVIITAAPTNTNQTVAQLVTAQTISGTQYDTSYNGSSSSVVNSNPGGSSAEDFDGAFAYIAGANSANFLFPDDFTGDTPVSGWTPDSVGGVLELNTAIQQQFLAYNAVPDEIVCGVDAITAITNATLQTTNSGISNFRVMQTQGADGQILGSNVLSQYRCKFSSNGQQTILPVSVSPNIPANAVWLPNRRNPFPSTSATIPAALQLAEIKPMYSMDYAKTRRTWELGTYVQTTLVNRTPFLGFVFSGFNSVVNS